MTAHESPDRIVFLPGYGQDPDLVAPFTSVLGERLGAEVTTADYYRRDDHRYYPQELPSLVLAHRVSDQLGYDDLPERLRVVSHAMGARVGRHFPRTSDFVMLAPEGFRRGGPELAKRFTSDIIRRAVFGAWHERTFALGQIDNLLRRPGASFGQAAEMLTESGRINTGKNTLAIAYRSDTVTPPKHVVEAVALPGVRYKSLDGDHYEPFHNPDPTVTVIEKHMRSAQ